MTSSGHAPAPLLLARQPSHVAFLAAVALYLLLAYTAVILVDVFDVAGSRAWVIRRVPHTGALWIHLFGEQSPTEILQWGLLAYLTVISGIMGGHWAASRAASSVGPFWKLVSVGAVLMLLEDAGNIRHRMVEFVGMTFGAPDSGLLRLPIEAAWYGLIAGVFAWAILRHGGPVRAQPTARTLGGLGVIAYALAAGMSVSSEAQGGWYVRAGAFIDERLLGSRLYQPTPERTEQFHFFLMDSLVEETLELVGAALLVAAAVKFLHAEAARHADTTREPLEPVG